MLSASKLAVRVALTIVAVAAGCDLQAVPASPPTGPFIVVANQRRAVATLVEIGSGRVSDVSLGAKPHEVAISPDARTAVLTIPSRGFLGGRKIVVLDLTRTSAVRTIDIGDYREPHGVAFVSDSVVLVGTLGGTSAVYVDVHTGKQLRSVE